MSTPIKATITHELEIDPKRRTADVVTYAVIGNDQMTILDAQQMPWPLQKGEWCAYGQTSRQFLLSELEPA